MCKPSHTSHVSACIEVKHKLGRPHIFVLEQELIDLVLWLLRKCGRHLHLFGSPHNQVVPLFSVARRSGALLIVGHKWNLHRLLYFSQTCSATHKPGRPLTPWLHTGRVWPLLLLAREPGRPLIFRPHMSQVFAVFHLWSCTNHVRLVWSTRKPGRLLILSG